MLKEVQDAVEAAFNKLKEDCGEEVTMDEGESFVTLFNNATLIIEKGNGKLNLHFIGGKPYKVDVTLKMYEENQVRGVYQEKSPCGNTD